MKHLNINRNLKQVEFRAYEQTLRLIEKISSGVEKCLGRAQKKVS